MRETFVLCITLQDFIVVDLAFCPEFYDPLCFDREVNAGLIVVLLMKMRVFEDALNVEVTSVSCCPIARSFDFVALNVAWWTILFQKNDRKGAKPTIELLR